MTKETCILGKSKTPSRYDPNLASELEKDLEIVLRKEALEAKKAKRIITPPIIAPIVGLDELVCKKGKLIDTYKRLDPNTIQHADEITKATLTNLELRKRWFLTADSAMYTVEKGEAVLYFGRRETNLIFNNLDQAVAQLLSTKNYIPSINEIKLVKDSVKSGNTLKIKLSELELTKETDAWYYFKINTSDYTKLNPEQKRFAERVYGQGTDFGSAMNMLTDANIASINIFVLNPEYIKSTLTTNAAPKAIVRACRLYDFDGNFDFDTENGDVDYADYCLRGVLK